jgi:tetratricopeptide (TPR) repeat protein
MAKLIELLKKAQALNKEGEYNKVIELLPDSLLETNNNADLFAEKAEAYYRLKKYESSSEAADKALAINPKHSRGNHFKGNFYLENKEYNKAIEYYGKAIEINPKYADPYNGLGNAYSHLKEYDKAIDYYNKVIEIDPKFIQPYINLGNTYSELKEYDKAIEYYTKVIEIDPKYVYSYHGIGNTYIELKEYNKAIEYYNKAIEIDPSFVYSYYKLGQAYYNLEEYDKAIQYCNKAIEIDPKYSNPYNGLGNVYDELKDYNKAIDYYKKAIEIDPKFEYPYSGLGNAYYELKDYNKAIVYYNKAIEIDPKYASPYLGLGNVYNELKDYNKAIDFYNKTIEIDPKYESSYNGLASTYYDLKEYDKAIDFYNKAIEIDPKFVHPYYNLGLTYYTLKEYAKAKKYYNKAIEIDPKYADAYYGLGINYNALKEYDNALGTFKKYVELTKSSPDYYTSIAESRITELNKLLDNKAYSEISKLVNEIRELLLYNEGRITHYTGLSVAKALILDGSLFRLSEGAFLNDTSEGRELFKFLSFDFSSNNGSDTVATPFTQKPFIGSFVSEIKHDDLTLWRMYGKEEKEEAKGCAITIDIKKLLDNLLDKMSPDRKTAASSKTDEEFSFYRVAYRKQGEENVFIIPGADDELEKKLNEYMNNLSAAVKAFNLKEGKESSDTQNVAELLNEIAYLFKSAEYQHEFEVRLVVKGIGFEKIIDSSLCPPRVYIELVSIRPVIQKITLGPKVERPDEWAAAFNYSLSKDGYEPEILISHLPFK